MGDMSTIAVAGRVREVHLHSLAATPFDATPHLFFDSQPLFKLQDADVCTKGK